MRNRWVISWLIIDYLQWSMSNRWVISWLVITYWWWSMSNRWVIEAQTFCGLSSANWWHRSLIDVIDYSSITHRLLIDYYTAHDQDTFLALFISFIILLSVLDASFLVSEVPVDDVETQSANHKYNWMILNCAICKTEQPWRDNRRRVVKQQTAKRYWRKFWSLISMCYLSWKE